GAAKGAYDDILIDQGDADSFLADQLKPELLVEAAKSAGQKLTLRMQAGYDHSYFFMARLAVLATAQPAAAQEQLADTDLPQVSSPAYARPGPVVWIDEGHGSLQTIAGRYAGFAVLLCADGYQVEAIQGAFDQPGALDDVKVLVVSNPRAPVG
ncbi:hypothetical protein LTR94_031806, partial [Friedmanniomyces endolithicus]